MTAMCLDSTPVSSQMSLPRKNVSSPAPNRDRKTWVEIKKWNKFKQQARRT